jgi:hypothetical protein
MATVAILSVLVKSDEGARQVAASAPGAMKLWEGICQLLGRKMDMERKYIERLEGEVRWGAAAETLDVGGPCDQCTAKALSVLVR